jgi:hypothetical protein
LFKYRGAIYQVVRNTEDETWHLDQEIIDLRTGEVGKSIPSGKLYYLTTEEIAEARKSPYLAKGLPLKEGVSFDFYKNVIDENIPKIY